MKAMILVFAMVLGLSVNVQAASFAEKTYAGSVKYEEALKSLFSQEMKKVGSPLNQFVTNLQKENPDYFVADRIDMEDIFTIESGASGGLFSVNYLLVVRGGYKSNNFPMAYLKAYITAPMDETAPYKVIIEEQAKVSIE